MNGLIWSATEKQQELNIPVMKTSQDTTHTHTQLRTSLRGDACGNAFAVGRGPTAQRPSQRSSQPARLPRGAQSTLSQEIETSDRWD